MITKLSYGLSKDKHSWLYYPPMTLGICINGQLILSMLLERTEHLGTFILQNTDGACIKVPKNKVDEYYRICAEFEKETGFAFEHETYDRLIVRDVNSYIGVYSNGKIKYKGAFEFNNLPVYKDKSMLIVPIALSNYFLKNIPVEETIKNHTIFTDFCKGVKSKNGAWFYLLNPKTSAKTNLQKVNRYYLSKKGEFLIKEFPLDESKQVTKQFNIFGDLDTEQRIVQVEAGEKSKVVNKLPKSFPTDIDYTYYIRECYKIIKQF